MGAVASIWLAIGLALFFAGAVAVVALCRMALRQGAEVEGEIKAPSLRLKFHARPPGANAEAGRECPNCGLGRDVPAARIDLPKENQ
jgi:hypothetical protein